MEDVTFHMEFHKSVLGLVLVRHQDSPANLLTGQAIREMFSLPPSSPSLHYHSGHSLQLDHTWILASPIYALLLMSRRCRVSTDLPIDSFLVYLRSLPQLASFSRFDFKFLL